MALPYALAELGHPVTGPPAAGVLVPAVLLADGEQEQDGCFDAPGVRGDRLYDHLAAGRPVLRA